MRYNSIPLEKSNRTTYFITMQDRAILCSVSLQVRMSNNPAIKTHGTFQPALWQRWDFSNSQYAVTYCLWQCCHYRQING